MLSSDMLLNVLSDKHHPCTAALGSSTLSIWITSTVHEVLALTRAAVDPLDALNKTTLAFLLTCNSTCIHCLYDPVYYVVCNTLSSK